MSNNPNLPESENTVDMLALCINACKSLGRGLVAMFKGIGVAIAACVGFVVRHFFLLLGAGVCGLVIIIINNHSSSERHLEGEAQLYCNIPLQNIEIEIDKLGSRIGDANLLASMLDINADLTRKISKISFGYGMDVDDDDEVDYVEYDKLKAGNIYAEKILKGGAGGDQLVKTPVKVKVEHYGFLKVSTTSNPAEFQEISHAICHYINQRPALQVLRALTYQELVTNIAEIEKQKNMLDSLLQIEYFVNSKLRAASFAQGGNKLVLADYKSTDRNLDGTIDYHDIISLTKQQNEMTTRLAKANEVVMIQSDFVPVATASVLTLNIGWLTLWMICFVVGALIYDYRKPLGEYIRKQRQK